MTAPRFMAQLFLGLVLGLAAHPTSVLAQVFNPDPHVGAITNAYIKDAVAHARRYFRITLDGNEASIVDVEHILAQLSASYRSANPTPSDEELSTMAKAYGSYIGEVFIRARGGEWGIAAVGEGDFTAIRGRAGRLFWPIGYVLKRVRHQAGPNLPAYYRSLLRN